VAKIEQAALDDVLIFLGAVYSAMQTMSSLSKTANWWPAGAMFHTAKCLENLYIKRIAELNRR
jgi:hypothetical protein